MNPRYVVTPRLALTGALLPRAMRWIAAMVFLLLAAAPVASLAQCPEGKVEVVMTTPTGRVKTLCVADNAVGGLENAADHSSVEIAPAICPCWTAEALAAAALPGEALSCAATTAAALCSLTTPERAWRPGPRLSTSSCEYAGVAQTGLTVPARQECRTLLEPYVLASISPGTVVGIATRPVPRADACGNGQGRACESLIGDVTADAMRVAYGTDFAVVNSGSIRADLTCSIPSEWCPVYVPPPHAITHGSVLTTHPFQNSVVTKSIRGDELAAYLENGVSGLPSTSSGRFPQVSGLCFTYAISAPVFSRVTAVVRQAPDGSCTGAPVDLSASAVYTIAINDFMAAGGDGYPVLSSAGTTHGTVDAVVGDHVLATSPVSPAIQGRITCTTAGYPPCPVVTP